MYILHVCYELVPERSTLRLLQCFSRLVGGERERAYDSQEGLALAQIQLGSCALSQTLISALRRRNTFSMKYRHVPLSSYFCLRHREAAAWEPGGNNHFPGIMVVYSHGMLWSWLAAYSCILHTLTDYHEDFFHPQQYTDRGVVNAGVRCCTNHHIRTLRQLSETSSTINVS